MNFLKQYFKNTTPNAKGYTHRELLLVFILVALLVALAVPAFGSVKQADKGIQVEAAATAAYKAGIAAQQDGVEHTNLLTVSKSFNESNQNVTVALRAHPEVTNGVCVWARWHRAKDLVPTAIRSDECVGIRGPRGMEDPTVDYVMKNKAHAPQK